MLKTFKNMIKALSDFIRSKVKPNNREATYVFLVHTRSFSDIYRRYPLSKYLPPKLLELLMFVWPIVILSRITGVKSLKNGENINGLLMAISFTPSMIRKRPKLLRKKVEKAIRKAEKRGVKLIGIGGLLPSYTRYGLYLKRFTNGIGVTTGHAYAAWTIAYYVEQAIPYKGVRTKKPVVAVVGTAGSTGSLTVETLVDRNIKAKLLLIDVPQKFEKLEKIAKRYKARKGAFINTGTQFSLLRKADIVVVVTNAIGSILKPEHIKSGAIIIDDSQPRNTSVKLLEKATVIDVLSDVPGLSLNFDVGLLKEKSEITFTCLAETAILAANGWHGDFSIGKPDISKVKEIASMAEAVGVKPAPYVSFSKITNKTKVTVEDKASKEGASAL